MNNENELNLISGVVNASDEEEVYETEENVSEQVETESAVTDNSDNDVSVADSKEAINLGNDIVEHIIDRVVERMTSNSRTDAADETTSAEQQCRTTPNFLSDIRPDFWDRI